MNRQGFTLIEVLVVVAIIGILAALGVPSYLNWIASSQAHSGALTLSQQVQQARTSAKRGAAQRLSTTAGSSVVTLTPVTYNTTTSAWENASGAAARSITLEGAKVDTTLNLVFTTPFGALDIATTTTPQTLVVKSIRNASKTRNVRVISLMGKTVIE